MLPGPGEVISCADYHTAGEPFRIVDAGPMEGDNVPDRRSWAVEHLDDLRRFLVDEPRGHSGMYGGFVVPPDDGGADLGVVFFHGGGFSTACGHGTIALVTWAIDAGVVAGAGDRVEVTVDVPSGRLRTVATMLDGRVASVGFRNVPSYVTAEGLAVETSHGRVVVDVAFGGAHYGFVDVGDLPVSASTASVASLVALGGEVKAALGSHPSTRHPADARLSGMYGVVFHEGTGPLRERNVTVFADRQVDRSPCGSATSARLALLHRTGDLEVGDVLLNEGVAGGVFEGRIVEVSGAGVVTTVEGSAHRYGSSELVLDPHDPMGAGFRLG